MEDVGLDSLVTDPQHLTNRLVWDTLERQPRHLGLHRRKLEALEGGKNVLLKWRRVL